MTRQQRHEQATVMIELFANLTLPETAEGVALALTAVISDLEGWPPRNNGVVPPREHILTLYKECLDTVVGYKQTVVDLERRQASHG